MAFHRVVGLEHNRSCVHECVPQKLGPVRCPRPQALEYRKVPLSLTLLARARHGRDAFTPQCIAHRAVRPPPDVMWPVDDIRVSRPGLRAYVEHLKTNVWKRGVLLSSNVVQPRLHKPRK